MKLLVGLGNPGPQYFLNRHNIGFLVIDALCQDYSIPPFKAKFPNTALTEGPIRGTKCLFLKPQGFMNLSGQAVLHAAHFYKIPPEDIIVFHDDLDLPFGRIRTKIGGGAGGHNGLKSLDRHLGPNYCRVRIGIDHPGDKERVTQHVLSDFSKQEQTNLAPIFDALSLHLPLLLEGQADSFQSKVAGDLQEVFNE